MDLHPFLKFSPFGYDRPVTPLVHGFLSSPRRSVMFFLSPPSPVFIYRYYRLHSCLLTHLSQLAVYFNYYGRGYLYQ